MLTGTCSRLCVYPEEFERESEKLGDDRRAAEREERVRLQEEEPVGHERLQQDVLENEHWRARRRRSRSTRGRLLRRLSAQVDLLRVFEARHQREKQLDVRAKFLVAIHLRRARRLSRSRRASSV